ncbi:hypothetical protein [Streptantibioticus silvisoli]|uniref:DUF1328 domain-containing protein n=1 Tax=Streptantibioticus silvisoli TaxID=2705255 RepID=A0ABT6W8S2_9ACTN|nr:hypothetical protein [Streptantibioticus silvisoli]MDI5967153.1 hypothetical protein [Streptantibioticus silvisoli]
MTTTTRIGIIAAVLLAAVVGTSLGADLAAHGTNEGFAALAGFLAFGLTAVGGRHVVTRTDRR